MRHDLRDYLTHSVIVADGAMGTVLQARGFPLGTPYELATTTHADMVRSIHAEYIAAGASLIETNTFGANRIKLASIGAEDDARGINTAAAQLAREAVEQSGVVSATNIAIVGGAIGPIGRPLAPLGTLAPDVAAAAFREQAEALIDAGVDAIVLETFVSLDELALAYAAVCSVASVPIITQKSFVEDGDTLAAGLPGRFAAECGSWEGVVAVGANCAVGPQRMVDLVRWMKSATRVPISVMPTPGLPQIVGTELRYSVSPEYFGAYGRRLVEAGAQIVGGCCGTTPAHIAAVARALQEAGLTSGEAPRTGRARTRLRTSPAPPPPLAVAGSARRYADHGSPPVKVAGSGEQPAPRGSEPSRLALALGEKYIVTVELDLPRGLEVDGILAGARSLKDHGCDLIDISDGARARLRMNPMAVAHLIQEEVGIEVMMHFACRDRNLLAIQADLLGAHALGLRNILAITGDPAQIGDYPLATSVFDVDSVGLIRILRHFNEGIDLAGNSIMRTTAFTIACAYDPLATDPAAQAERLRRKVEEGAQIIYTQPIFEWSVLEDAVEAVARHRRPMFFGLLPLRSARHAEFIHNEVPGMCVPEVHRKRLAALDDKDARRYGIDVAREFLARARAITQGVYMMPPFGNHRVAEAVLEALV